MVGRLNVASLLFKVVTLNKTKVVGKEICVLKIFLHFCSHYYLYRSIVFVEVLAFTTNIVYFISVGVQVCN